MAFQLAEAYVEISQRGFKGVRRGISGIASSFTKMGRTSTIASAAVSTSSTISAAAVKVASVSIAASLAVATYGLAAIAAGAIAAATAIYKTVGAASDMEEVMNKFNVVFGDSATEVKAWSDEFAGTMGRSKKQIADFMAGTQDLLVPMGFEPGAATKMSRQITRLSVDLASFNNLQDADVLNDIQAALTGSGEVMKKYGVIVNETAVKQELLNQGIDKNNATEQQKAQARMNIIMRGTTAAQGDAERSAGSLANQNKRLWATVNDVSVTIGNMFLPAATKVVSMAGDIVGWIGKWLDKNKEIVDSVVFVSENIGLYSQIAAEKMKIAFWNGVEFVRAAFVYLVEKGIWVGENIGAIAGQVVEDFKTLGNNIVTIVSWLQGNWNNIFKTMFDYATTGFINVGKNIQKTASEIWDYVKSAGSNKIDFSMEPVFEGAKNYIEKLPEMAESKMTEAYKEAQKSNPEFNPKIKATSSDLDELNKQLTDAKQKSTEKAAKKTVVEAGVENQTDGAGAAASTAAGAASNASNSAAILGSSGAANILAGAFGGYSEDKQADIAKYTKATSEGIRKMAKKLDSTPIIVAG